MQDAFSEVVKKRSFYGQAGRMEGGGLSPIGPDHTQMWKFLDISIETAAPHETIFVILPLPEAMIATDGSFWLPLYQKDIFQLLYLRALHSSFFAFAASAVTCTLSVCVYV